MRARDLLQPGPEGLYCPPGDFFIDPVRPVDRALITHGHSDHARSGHGTVLATRQTLDIMALRYGEDFAGADAGGRARRGDRRSTASRVTFHPAGHVLGSAQIAVEHGGTAHRRLRRLQAPAPIRPARPSSRSTATSSSPRRPSACRCSAIRRTRRRDRAAAEVGRSSFPSARIWSAPMRWARRSASCGCCATPATTSRSTSMARWQKLSDYYQSQGIDLGELRAGDGRDRQRRATSPARSSSARRRPSPTAGRGAFPIRSRASPPAGCASASAPSRAASNCR